MTTATTESVSVFITTYNIYNNGMQFNSPLCKWYEVESTTYEELVEAMIQAEKELGIYNGSDVELMCTDSELVPDELYCESFGESVFDSISEYAELDEDTRNLANIIMEHIGLEFREAIEKAVSGEYYLYESEGLSDASQDYAYDLYSDIYGTDSPLFNYVDWNRVASDLELDGVFIEIDSNTLLIGG